MSITQESDWDRIEQKAVAMSPTMPKTLPIDDPVIFAIVRAVNWLDLGQVAAAKAELLKIILSE